MKYALRLLLTLLMILCCTTNSGASIKETHSGVVFEKLCVLEGEIGFGADFNAPKSTPKWPKTAQEMDEFLKVPGKKVQDGSTTPGRDKTVWKPNKDTKITREQHPYHPDAPDWHKDPHWHLDTPKKRHERFLPGDDIPGY